jgi:hypothetical protein
MSSLMQFRLLETGPLVSGQLGDLPDANGPEFVTLNGSFTIVR